MSSPSLSPSTCVIARLSPQALFPAGLDPPPPKSDLQDYYKFSFWKSLFFLPMKESNVSCQEPLPQVYAKYNHLLDSTNKLFQNLRPLLSRHAGPLAELWNLDKGCWVVTRV